MDWWNVSVFGAIPILSVVIIFCFKRKYLWSAPLVSIILAAVISLIAMPAILEDVEASNMFLRLVLPMHFAITLILTAVAYGISFVLRNKHKSYRA